MAEVELGFNGMISGKLGAFVLYRVGGKTYLRKRPKRREKAPSEGQARQQSKLSGAMVMYRFVKQCKLKQVFAAWAKETGARSGYNLFLSKNMNAFGQNDYVDYSLLVAAGGSLQLPNELSYCGLEGNRATFTWTDNTSGDTARSDDRMQAAVITEDEPYRIAVPEETAGLRLNGKGSVALPEGAWQTAHVYVFFSTADGNKHSPCVYFKIEKPQND